MLISFLFFVLGIEFAYYFYAGNSNFLRMIPLGFVNENVTGFSYTIIILTFLGGFISGVVAVECDIVRKISTVVMILNLVGILVVGFIWGFGVYKDYRDNKKAVMESRTTSVIQNEDTGNVSQSMGDETASNTENVDNTQSVDEQEENEQTAVEPTPTEEPQPTKAEEKENTVAEKTQKDKAKKKTESAKSENTQKTQENKATEASESQQDLWFTRYSFECGENMGTWEDAYKKCKENNAHLVTFENKEEFDYVAEKLTNMGYQDYIFYIGGRRDMDSDRYYWIDENNSLTGSVLNNAEYWAAECWMPGEPSFKDASTGVEEHVMCMFYQKDLGRWVWNDIPNDLVSAIPSYEGKVGIIYEYES